MFPLNGEGRVALTQLLQATPLREVNTLLAQVALFAPEADIRGVAIQALKTRRGKDHEIVLLEGLNYPLASVANNAADAIIKLDLRDHVIKIADHLDSFEGQTPYAVNGRFEVREVVKINHSRNCVLCHSPAPLTRVLALGFPMTAPIPNPTEKPPSEPANYYFDFDAEKSVRFDVTYLRPDFSLTLPDDRHYSQWPEQQRYDFIVRTRILSAEEAATFEKARPVLPHSPNREAALRVLRALTNEDVGDRSEAWSELVNSDEFMRTRRLGFFSNLNEQD